ncbi:MAG: hypothetical protein ACK4ZW_06450 [Blastomonas sp.]
MNIMRLIAALATPLLLTGCLLSPGKFASTLDLQGDGSFTFTYAGEIVVTDTSSPPAEFSASPCYDQTTYDERECTSAELAQQRKEFDAAQASNPAEAGMAGAGMGEFGSEESIAELVDQLQKQQGWKSVRYRGNRIIDVEYEISGHMSHGFAFPLIEGGGAVMPFVTITRRKDGNVKIVAPAYSGGGAGGEVAGLGALAGAAGGSNKAAQPKPEGTFTITTDGRILTNNTQDGPAAAGGKSVLTWAVNARLDKGPEALIGLAGQ